MLGHITLVTARVDREVDQDLLTQCIAGIDFARLINFDGNGRIFEPYGLHKGVQGPHAGKFKRGFKAAGEQELGTETLGPKAVFQGSQSLCVALRQIENFGTQLTFVALPLFW